MKCILAFLLVLIPFSIMANPGMYFSTRTGLVFPYINDKASLDYEKIIINISQLSKDLYLFDYDCNFEIQNQLNSSQYIQIGFPILRPGFLQ
jgi:hypothetical protein